MLRSVDGPSNEVKFRSSEEASLVQYHPFNPKPHSAQSDLTNGAPFRGTALPAMITGGTPVPQFFVALLNLENLDTGLPWTAIIPGLLEKAGLL